VAGVYSRGSICLMEAKQQKQEEVKACMSPSRAHPSDLNSSTRPHFLVVAKDQTLGLWIGNIPQSHVPNPNL
jgi:hypothetical protein